MPATIERLELIRHDEQGGRWVRVRRDARSVRIDVGTTGNALDADRRVRLASHELVRRPGPALRSTWPVREVATHRAVRVLDDLRAELAAAASPDPDADLCTVHRWWLALDRGDDHAQHLAASPDDGRTDLAGDVLRRAYPLLATPVAAGARPDVVPLAAEVVVGRADPRTAAGRAFGRVTRPLVRALATTLMPDDRGRIVWEPLLLALMAAGRCGPEQLTAVLTTPVHRPGAVSFSLHDVQRARAMVVDQHPRTVAERWCAALREPGGTARLAAEVSAWDARPPAPARVPPPTPPAPPEPARRAAAPRAPVGDPCEAPVPYPRRFRALAGAAVAGHRVELVARPDDLLRWGEQMANCLGAYRAEVARGRTHIVGFTLRGELRVVAEISPAGALRQLEAAANTRPPPTVEHDIVAFLRRHRVMEVDARRA